METLRTGGPLARIDAASTLGKMGSAAEPAVPALADELAKQPDIPFAIAILVALGRIDSEKSMLAIRRASKDPDQKIRVLAVEVLGEFGQRSQVAIEGLIDALKDRDMIVSFRASQGLARIGHSALPAITAGLVDKDAKVREGVARALMEMGPAGKTAVPALISALNDDERLVALEAALALSKIGTPAVPHLITALSNKSPRVRWTGALALQLIGPSAKTAVPALNEALRDSDPDVRQQAASALAKIAGR